MSLAFLLGSLPAGNFREGASQLQTAIPIIRFSGLDFKPCKNVGSFGWEMFLEQRSGVRD